MIKINEPDLTHNLTFHSENGMSVYSLTANEAKFLTDQATYYGYNSPAWSLTFRLAGAWGATEIHNVKISKNGD